MLEVDDYGTVLRSAAVAYPRRGTPEHPEQSALHVTLSEADIVHLDGDPNSLRVAVPIESRSYELHGLAAPGKAAFAWNVAEPPGTRNPNDYGGTRGKAAPSLRKSAPRRKG